MIQLLLSVFQLGTELLRPHRTPPRLVGYLVVVADALEPWRLPKPAGLALGALVAAGEAKKRPDGHQVNHFCLIGSENDRLTRLKRSK